jgi:hypothetical protein
MIGVHWHITARYPTNNSGSGGAFQTFKRFEDFRLALLRFAAALLLKL